MRYIAMIAITGIIVLGVLIGIGINRLKNRQAEELAHLRARMNLAQDQLGIAKRTLRTINDLQGDSAFDASIALEQINRLDDEYYDKAKEILR